MEKRKIMRNILEETKFFMNRYHIKANKSLGQNFLISEEVIQKIVESSQITKQDLVIEIGPGLGTLTERLLEKAGKVIAIELDEKMVKILSDRFLLDKNFELLKQDVLKVDLKSLIQEEREKNGWEKVKIVANLPYYITTPIIMKLLEEELPLDRITVMIQKEVADRLIAIPGEKETGAITYRVFYYAQAQGILEVPNDCFIPNPEVTSKVINLKIRENPPIKIEEKEVMFRIIKCAFMQKRKTLLNALVNTNVFKDKQQGIEILEKLGIDIEIRPEKLSLEDYANISKCILNQL